MAACLVKATGQIRQQLSLAAQHANKYCWSILQELDQMLCHRPGCHATYPLYIARPTISASACFITHSLFSAQYNPQILAMLCIGYMHTFNVCVYAAGPGAHPGGGVKTLYVQSTCIQDHALRYFSSRVAQYVGAHKHSVSVRLRQDLAYILATGYVALSLLLSGFYLRLNEFKLRPLVWLSYISYPRCAATLHDRCWCFCRDTSCA